MIICTVKDLYAKWQAQQATAAADTGTNKLTVGPNPMLMIKAKAHLNARAASLATPAK